MQTIYDPDLKAPVTLDESGQVRGINHLDEYREMEHLRGSAAAVADVRDIAEKFNITSEALRGLEQRASSLDPQEKEVEYRFSEEKTSFDSATYAYYHTYLNTLVWAAGVTATVKQAPARIVAATNTSEQGIDAKMPSAEAIKIYRRLFATGENSAEVTTSQLKVFALISRGEQIYRVAPAGRSAFKVDRRRQAIQPQHLRKQRCRLRKRSANWRRLDTSQVLRMDRQAGERQVPSGLFRRIVGSM